MISRLGFEHHPIIERRDRAWSAAGTLRLGEPPRFASRSESDGTDQTEKPSKE
jgi:hypothetical protein